MSKQYPKYTALDLPSIDKEILEFWQRERIFERSVEEREGAKPFVFFEGPPSANGLPGIHHVLARAVKDTFCRFQTMLGKQVRRKAGWDTHGLPIELAVEKKLGITKEDIGKKISVEDYNSECRRTVMEYKDLWDEVTRKMGYWVDLNNPYVTYENDYIESVWHLLQKIYNKGLLYKGYTIQPYSPAAGTGLSSHELNQPGCYKPVKDTTVVAMFEAAKPLPEKLAQVSKYIQETDHSRNFATKGNDGYAPKVHFLAWTTTPWTLPSNTALTVGANIDYAVVATTNPYTNAEVIVILAEAALTRYFGGKNQPTYTQICSLKGKELEGIRFEQLLPFGNEIEPLDGKTDAFRVLTADFVTTEDGTGIVHTAPSFGADDRKAARANGIGTLTLVDKQGKFIDSVGEFSNRFVKNYRNEADYKEVDVDIAIKLKTEGKAFNVQKYEHNYPHCWRTDKPILYYPLDSWFIAVSRPEVKERMVALNETINWKPASTGEGRFGNWLKNAQDWNLSRSRYWGIPLPLWRTEDGEGETVCIGSVEELRTRVEAANAVLGLQQTVPTDLHRPFIDEIVLVSSKGEPMRRELDLIDVWFDSGAMPYAQHHYPFENSDLIEKGLWQADFIAEGVDQTRGWFYTLHAIATVCFDDVAYKNVVSNGLVLDKFGQKMSKRLGNAVDPFETIAQYGADAVRWYMLTNAQPWDDLRFNMEGLRDTQRTFFGTLYNTYQFFATYANIDAYDGAQGELPLSECSELDRWIISALNGLVKAVSADFANYEPTQAGRRIADFVDRQLSNWYLRLSRRRFWSKGAATDASNKDKYAAYQTLHRCLSVLAKLMAPIAPFFSDRLHRDLAAGHSTKAADSVHLSLFPQYEETEQDSALEQRMDYAMRLASLVLSLRKRENMRVRQPLQKILLPSLGAGFEAQIERVKDILLMEVNVKELAYITDTDGLVTKKIKPNFKTMGKKLGAQMKAAQALVDTFTQEDIRRIEKAGGRTLTLEGVDYAVELADFIISSEDIKGWLVANDGELVVALDVSLTPMLEAEGTARELVNRIQNLRKDSGLEVTDRIAVSIEKQSVLTDALTHFGDYIANEVLATNLHLSDTPLKEAQEVEFLEEGAPLRLRIEKV